MITYTTKRQRGESAESLNLRVPARFKFVLELIARVEGSSVTALSIEAIEELVKKRASAGSKPAKLASEVWDALEPDRFVKLAKAAPELLNQQEQIRWKVLKEDKTLWTRDGAPALPEIRKKWASVLEEADRLEREFGS